jgi:hypothetical protein
MSSNKEDTKATQDPQRQLNSTANSEVNTTLSETTSIPKTSISRSSRRKAGVRGLGPRRWGKEARTFNNEFGLEALQILLGISKSTPSSTKILDIALGCKDPVFVLIDIEGGGNSSADEPLHELGVSVFDARILQNSTTSDPYSAISTLNYTTQRNVAINRQGSTFWETNAFRHGQTQYIEERWVGWLLDKFLSNGSPDPACLEVRNTILVGHCIGGDLGLLTNPRGGKFKFSLQKFPNVPVLDTQIIAQRWFGSSRKLNHIMVELAIYL